MGGEGDGEKTKKKMREKEILRELWKNLRGSSVEFQGLGSGKCVQLDCVFLFFFLTCNEGKMGYF